MLRVYTSTPYNIFWGTYSSTPYDNLLRNIRNRTLALNQWNYTSTPYNICWGTYTSTPYGICWGTCTSNPYGICWRTYTSTPYDICWGTYTSIPYGICWGRVAVGLSGMLWYWFLILWVQSNLAYIYWFPHTLIHLLTWGDTSINPLCHICYYKLLNYSVIILTFSNQNSYYLKKQHPGIVHVEVTPSRDWKSYLT